MVVIRVLAVAASEARDEESAQARKYGPVGTLDGTLEGANNTTCSSQDGFVEYRSSREHATIVSVTQGKTSCLGARAYLTRGKDSA